MCLYQSIDIKYDKYELYCHLYEQYIMKDDIVIELSDEDDEN